MKRWAYILCTLVALCTASDFAISYIGGRLGCFLIVPPLLPAEVVPSLLSLVCIVALVVFQLGALFKRTGRTVVLAMLLLSLVLASIPWMIMRARVFQVGFRHRITSRLSPDELRHIAAVAREVMDDTDRAALSYSRGTPREKWEKLEKQTRLDRLGDRSGFLRGLMSVIKTPDGVKLSWGGSLIGHWGVMIDSGSGSGADSNANTDDIAPGIRTFIDSK